MSCLRGTWGGTRTCGAQNGETTEAWPFAARSCSSALGMLFVASAKAQPSLSPWSRRARPQALRCAGRTMLLAFLVLGSGHESSRATSERLRQALLRLDLDGDGTVSRAEAATGILSSSERLAPPPPPATHAFGEAQCLDPTLDAMSFVECTVALARRRGNDGGRPFEGLWGAAAFESALRHFLGGCAADVRNTTCWRKGYGSCSECTRILSPPLSVLSPPTTLPTLVPPIPPPKKPPTGTSQILLSSDWHTEPWYETSSPWIEDQGCSNRHQGEVCRFASASLHNMFSCRDSKGTVVACNLHGGKDPPIEMEESHLASPATAGANVHFFLGDTQAHGWTWLGNPSSADLAPSISKLMNRVLAAEVARFGKSGVVWTAGNNDGPHDAAFMKQDACTVAWADSMLQAGIVTDAFSTDLNVTYSRGRSTTALFRDTGFYAKPLPQLGPATYAIVLNTNLGGSNAEMKAAVAVTLGAIASQHGNASAVYVLGHHPSVVGSGTQCGYIPSQYRALIKGVFGGHTHMAQDTTSHLYTQVPAITMDGLTGFWLATVSAAAPEVRLSEGEDLYTYHNNPLHLPPNASHWLLGIAVREESGEYYDVLIDNEDDE